MHLKQKLEKLNQELLHWQIDGYNKDKVDWQSFISYFDRITCEQIGNYFAVSFYGSGEFSIQEDQNYELPEYIPLAQNPDDYEYYVPGIGFSRFCKTILQHQEEIISIELFGPDEGANGIRNWDLTALAQAPKQWTKLSIFTIQLYEQGFHNFISLGESPELLSQVLSKMPNIVELTLPAVPDESFFKNPPKKLRYLRIQCMWDNHHFIKNLSQSNVLSHLNAIDFQDVLNDDELSYKSPQEQYVLERDGLMNEEMEKALVSGMSAAEFLKQQEIQNLKEAGYSKEEIELEMELPNRERTKELLEIIYKDEPEEIEAAMEYYDESERWDENGEMIEELYDDEFLEGLEEESSPSLNKRTPIEDYIQFFSSPILKKRHKKSFRLHFTLRDFYLTQEEQFQIQQACPEIQFFYIPMREDYYVSHRIEDLEYKN